MASLLFLSSKVEIETRPPPTSFRVAFLRDQQLVSQVRLPGRSRLHTGKNKPRLPIREVGFKVSFPRPAPSGGLEGYAGGL